MNIAHDTQRQLLRLSRELCEMPDRESYLNAAPEALTALFLADDVFWISVDLTRHTAQLRRTLAGGLQAAGMPTADLSDHPSIVSYLSHPADLVPRRVSDCATSVEWCRTRSYNQVFASTGGMFQLSLITRLEPSIRGEGWILTRSSTDFGDEDVDLACALLPTLTVFDRLYPSPVPEAPSPPDDGPTGKVSLTPRELQILHLLEGGRTAEAMARMTGTSRRTVSKHLQHIYEKLGIHDRLLAVERARTLGLLTDRHRH